MRHKCLLCDQEIVHIITLGLDPHPESYGGCSGSEWASLSTLTVLNTPGGLSQLHQFAIPFSTRRWVIEGAGNHFVAFFVGQL